MHEEQSKLLADDVLRWLNVALCSLGREALQFNLVSEKLIVFEFPHDDIFRSKVCIAPTPLPSSCTSKIIGEAEAACQPSHFVPTSVAPLLLPHTSARDSRIRPTESTLPYGLI